MPPLPLCILACRIVLKTVTSFSPPAIKEEAEAKLSSLVRSSGWVWGALPACREGVTPPPCINMHTHTSTHTTMRLNSPQVLSYQKVDSYLEMAREGNPDTLGKAREQLAVTLATAQDIEALVIRVLGV